jgi:hypothetical protein
MKSIMVEDFHRSTFLEKVDAALAPYTPDQIVNVQFTTEKFGYEAKYYALIIVNTKG